MEFEFLLALYIRTTTNETIKPKKTMKGIMKMIIALFGLALISSSCASSANCEAYGNLEYDYDKIILEQQNDLNLPENTIHENEMF